MKKYELVFRHDRAGRLVDAREFERLKFERRRFSVALLEELRTEAAGSVEFGDDTVVLHHLYTERRLRPLDLYLRESTPAEGRVAILDYGGAIRDLARSNILPGDMLLKNFGVTRHGRIVFYDYDEVAVLTRRRSGSRCGRAARPPDRSPRPRLAPRGRRRSGPAAAGLLLPATRGREVVPLGLEGRLDAHPAPGRVLALRLEQEARGHGSRAPAVLRRSKAQLIVSVVIARVMPT